MRIKKYQAQKGEKFGHLTFTGDYAPGLDRGERKRILGVWKCDCGATAKYRIDTVMCGNLRSCGCLSKNKAYKTRLWAKYGDDYPYYVLLSRAEKRAIAHSIKFDLTIDDIKKQFENQKGLCFYTGQQLQLPANFTCLTPDDIASIDRIDSKIGYLPENIQFVSKKINFMKQQYSHDVFLDTCNKVVQYIKKI